MSQVIDSFTCYDVIRCSQPFALSLVMHVQFMCHLIKTKTKKTGNRRLLNSAAVSAFNLWVI